MMSWGQAIFWMVINAILFWMFGICLTWNYASPMVAKVVIGLPLIVIQIGIIIYCLWQLYDIFADPEDETVKFKLSKWTDKEWEENE